MRLKPYPASPELRAAIDEFKTLRERVRGMKTSDPAYPSTADALKKAHDRLAISLRRGGRFHRDSDGVGYGYSRAEGSVVVLPPLKVSQAQLRKWSQARGRKAAKPCL